MDNGGLRIAFRHEIEGYQSATAIDEILSRGAIIGLINYPRFPTTMTELLTHATKLAKILKKHFKQNRVSILNPVYTETLGEK
jgi:hypothetical protein